MPCPDKPYCETGISIISGFNSTLIGRWEDVPCNNGFYTACFRYRCMQDLSEGIKGIISSMGNGIGEARDAFLERLYEIRKSPIDRKDIEPFEEKYRELMGESPYPLVKLS
jgi:hypothetical protein